MRCIFHETDQSDWQTMASQRVSCLEDMEITHTELASGVLRYVQAHVSLSLISLMGLCSYWNHLLGTKCREALQPC